MKNVLLESWFILPVCRDLFRAIFAGESDVEEVPVLSDGAEGRADVGLKVVPPQAELVRRSHDAGIWKEHTSSHTFKIARFQKFFVIFIEVVVLRSEIQGCDL